MRTSLITVYFCAISFFAFDAQAQTAEETVAFVVWGFEDILSQRKDQIHFISKSPAVVEFKGDDGKVNAKLTVTRKNDCEYVVRGEVLAKPAENIQSSEELAEINFSNVTAISIKRGVVEIINERTINTTNGSACKGIISKDVCKNLQAENVETIVQNIDFERYESAVRYFREKFCRGRAF
jgi:environmental stress-induced protein Ves